MERELSRLRLKPKLGYKLPAEALLIGIQVIVLPKREDNKNEQNNRNARTIVHWTKVDETIARARQ
jgi:hypothetical protein